MKINFENTGSYKVLENSINYSKTDVKQSNMQCGVVYSANQNLEVEKNRIDKGYNKSGKTKEDIMKEASNINLDAQSDYMTVMSNTMSNEDFQRMCDEGYDPSEMTPEETITVSDRIKAALMASGTYIPGYTDQISGDVLKEITGNEGLAEQMQAAFNEVDAYLHQKNAEEVVSLLQMSKEIRPLSIDEMAYMVKEDMAPTVNNIYMIQHSLGTSNVVNQIPDADWEAIKSETEKIIEEAGLENNKDNVNIARNLLERNLPLTKENVKSFITLQNLPIPLDEKQIISSAACAVADGKQISEADVTKSTTNWQQAKELYAEINEMPEPNELHARRVLEETRLIMTIDANKKLIENNVAIDISNLEDLVEKLRASEKEIAKVLFPKQDETEAVKALRKLDNYKITVDDIKGMPLGTVSLLADKLNNHSLTQIATEGNSQKYLYEQRGEAYETFMTVPRADLGDKISEAFKNAEILLNEIGLEGSEENKRAVRALGYNSMDITKENIDLVKQADMTLQNVVSRMTPSVVLKMIRDGVNPLENSLEDIDKYLTTQGSSAEAEQKKYSEYLYDLEKNNEISTEEREGFIGIYRLIRQVEKTDGAALGSLINQGNEISFDNLFHAVRTRKAKRTDIKIDDNEIIKLKGIAENSIDSQINVVFKKQNARFEERKLEEDIKQIASEIKEKGEKSYHEYTREIYIKEIMENPLGEATLSSILERLDETPTLENMYYISDFWKNSGKIYERIKAVTTKENQKALEEEAQKLAGEQEDTEPVVSYEDFLQECKACLEKTLENKLDITSTDAQTIGLLHKQIGFAIKSIKEQHYHFPVEIGNNISNINLTLKKSATGKETIEASMDTDILGKVTINLSVSGEKIGGIIVHEKTTNADIINALEKSISNEIKALGYECNKIYNAISERIEIRPFEKSMEDDIEELSKHSVNKLFSIAKRVLKTVSETLK